MERYGVSMRHRHRIEAENYASWRIRGFLAVAAKAVALLGWLLLGAAATHASGTNAPEPARVIVAVGAAGEEDYGKEFAKWAGLWAKASDQAEANFAVVGLGPTNATADLALLKQLLASEPTNSPAELWLVLIGHGTFDGKEAKFNLRGPDLSATELAEWLKPFHRPVIVINCASSSGPFLNKLSAPGRVIVTATKSGYEENYARFGQFFAAALTDPLADLDKDDQVSLLEAFIMASRRVAEFYAAEGRLVTETALLDDNGDGLGTPADFYRGVRATKKPAGGATVDGVRAHQLHLVRSPKEVGMSPVSRAQRDALELALAALREAKPDLSEAEYYDRLERLLRPLAALYSELDTPGVTAPHSPTNSSESQSRSKSD